MAAIEVYGVEKPKPEITETIDVPVHIQERFVVRFAYGLHDTVAANEAQRAVQNHPDWFPTYEAAKAWAVQNARPGMAFGITKLYARLTAAELDEVYKTEAGEAAED